MTVSATARGPRANRSRNLLAQLRQDAHLEGMPFGTRGGMRIDHIFPVDADYEFRINVAGFGKGVGMQKGKGGFGRIVGAPCALDQHLHGAFPFSEIDRVDGSIASAPTQAPPSREFRE